MFNRMSRIFHGMTEDVSGVEIAKTAEMEVRRWREECDSAGHGCAW